MISLFYFHWSDKEPNVARTHIFFVMRREITKPFPLKFFLNTKMKQKIPK